jgi:HSP20 family protein
MDLRVMGLDPNVIDTLHELLDFSDDSDKSHHAPSRAYIRDSKAMAATPADLKEYPDAFVFVLDMPGLKPDQIKVQLEEDNKLVVTCEWREEEGEREGARREVLDDGEEAWEVLEEVCTA